MRLALLGAQHMGEILLSVDNYRFAIEHRKITEEDYAEAWLNLSALHHKHGKLEVSERAFWETSILETKCA